MPLQVTIPLQLRMEKEWPPAAFWIPVSVPDGPRELLVLCVPRGEPLGDGYQVLQWTISRIIRHTTPGFVLHVAVTEGP
jgi:hypothetical protein